VDKREERMKKIKERKRERKKVGSERVGSCLD
jgi:hypothetical protein